MRTHLLAAFACLTATASFAQGAKTVADGVYTDAQAERGRAAFMTNCSACHGTNLQGVNESPDLSSKMFLSHWQDRSLGDLFAYVSTAMPAGAPGSLGNKTYGEVVAFILSKNGFKPGAAELPAGDPSLDAIGFPKK